MNGLGTTPIFIIGALCLLAGYLIRFRQMPRLMIGYNPDRVADKEGYAKWTGLNMILIGVILLIAGASRILYAQADMSLINNIFIFVLFILIVATFYGSKRYEKRD